MRIIFRAAVLMALFALAATLPDQSPAQAPDDGRNAPISRARPFLPGTPTWEDAHAVATGVLNRNENAIERFQRTGLTYAPMLALYDRYNPYLLDAHYEHRDWIEAMQSWEHTLINSPPSAILTLYEQLTGRFMDREAQLARAIIYTAHYGDDATLRKMIDLAPRSVWVKAALGWLRHDGMAPLDAVEAMLEVIPQYRRLPAFRMEVPLSQLRPRRERPSPPDERTGRMNYTNISTPAGMFSFSFMPDAWYRIGLFERMGALTAEAGDARATQRIAARLASLVEGDERENGMLGMFEIGLNPLATEYETDVLIENLARYASGPVLLCAAVRHSPDWQWFARTLASVIAFHGMPDLTVTRRFMLARVFQREEVMLSRIGARLVLSVYDDDIAGYSDIARALMMFSQDDDLKQSYEAALRSTRNRELRRVADAMRRNNAESLNAVPASRSLSLSLANKAKIMAAFAHASELEVHGGEVGVYWMSRAVAYNGARNRVAGLDAWFEAMRATHAADRNASPNATVVEFQEWAKRNLNGPDYEAMLAARRSQNREVVEMLPRQLAMVYYPEQQVRRSQMLAAEGQIHAATPFSEAELSELKEHPKKYGGAGLMLASESELVSMRLKSRRELYEKACNMSPLSNRLHLIAGPQNQAHGTYRTANWHIAAIHAIAKTMVEPWSSLTVKANAMVQSRTGELPYTLSSQSFVTGCRPSSLFTSPASSTYNNELLYGVREHGRVLQREAAAAPDRLISAEARGYLDEVIWRSRRMIEYYQAINRHTASAGALEDFQLAMMNASLRKLDQNDVNQLLNIAFTCACFAPETAIELVTKARRIGISPYGEFVGAQGLVSAHAQLGTLDTILPHYHEVRRRNVGIPANLDIFMLNGLAISNRYEDVGKAIEAISRHRPLSDQDNFHLAWRRAHLMIGKYDDIGRLALPENNPLFGEGVKEWSHLFHEAPALLMNGRFEELIKRTDHYMDFESATGMGIYVDAGLLRAVAMKLSAEGLPRDRNNRIRVAPELLLHGLISSPALLDHYVLEMLCGNAPLADIPAMTVANLWHANLYSERTGMMHGAGRLTPGSTVARDHFVRGVLAWLRDDNAAAREALSKCVEADQRTHHEYHIAKWMLEAPLKE